MAKSGARAEKRRKARAQAKANKAVAFKRDGNKSKYAQKRLQQARGRFKPESPFYNPEDPTQQDHIVIPENKRELWELLMKAEKELDDAERKRAERFKNRRDRRDRNSRFGHHDDVTMFEPAGAEA